MAKIKIGDLSCEYVDGGTLGIDWAAEREDGEELGWESWEANACDDCGALVLLSCGQGDDKHDRCDDNPRVGCQGHVSLAEGPMMSYWYPCDWSRYAEDAEDAAKRIAHLPLCLVDFADGRKGLALTGGGMDLSWEICEAFMLLGYMPPLHFAGNLPTYRSSSRAQYRRMRLVLSGARASARWSRRHAESVARNLARLTKAIAPEQRP